MARPVDADTVARAVIRAGRRRGRHHVPLAPQQHQLMFDLAEAVAEVTHIVLHREDVVISGSPDEYTENR